MNFGDGEHGQGMQHGAEQDIAGVRPLSSQGKGPEHGNREHGNRHAPRVVSARGTEDGLILRIDGRAEWDQIVTDLHEFLGERRKFLEGGEVSIEWLDRLPTKEQGLLLETTLRENFSIEIIGRRKKPAQGISVKEDTESNASGPKKASPIPLFSRGEERRMGNKQDQTQDPSYLEREGASLRTGMGDGLGKDAGSPGASFSIGEDAPLFPDLQRKNYGRMAEVLGDDIFYDEEANAKVVFGTLRSGQRVETPYSLLIIGDVNPGADVIAGGDIVIFGSLRGTAHASAYNDDATDRVIIALQMRPMQLRIGSVISRGSEESVEGAEIARIEDRRIIVESFHPRFSTTRKIR